MQWLGTAATQTISHMLLGRNNPMHGIYMICPVISGNGPVVVGRGIAPPVVMIAPVVAEWVVEVLGMTFRRTFARLTVSGMTLHIATTLWVFVSLKTVNNISTGMLLGVRIIVPVTLTIIMSM